MKRLLCLLLCLVLLPVAALCEEVSEPVELTGASDFVAPTETADGTPIPEKIQTLIDVAHAQFVKHDWAKLPKNNEYTRWYYGDERKIGWCSVFQIWCMHEAGIPLFKNKDIQVPEDGIFGLAEGKPGNVKVGYEGLERFVLGEAGGIPQPGYLVVYGVRGSTPYTHIAIVETVTPLGDGVYELTTVEGNINSSVRRYRYRYDATPKARYKNMSTVPTEEQTDENCQYKLHSDKWYVTGFAVTWGDAAYEPES